jgi:hypothetical protein
MFQSPHQSQETYKKKKGWKTWKGRKLKKTFAYNDNVLQNRGGLSSLQNY